MKSGPKLRIVVAATFPNYRNVAAFDRLVASRRLITLVNNRVFAVCFLFVCVVGSIVFRTIKGREQITIAYHFFFAPSPSAALLTRFLSLRRLN